MDYFILVFVAVIGIILFGLAIFIWWIKSFKHTVVIRQLTGGKTVITSDKAKIFTDIDRVEYWRLLRMKRLLPLPPKDAICVTKKGKFFVEAYMMENGEFQYIYDSVIKYDQSYYRMFQPLTTNQRLMLINQIRKAESKRKKSFSDMIPQIAAYAMVLIVFFGVILFWEDITKPSKEASANLASASGKLAEAMDKYDNIRNNVQTINSNGNSNNNGAPP